MLCIPENHSAAEEKVDEYWRYDRRYLPSSQDGLRSTTDTVQQHHHDVQLEESSSASGQALFPHLNALLLDLEAIIIADSSNGPDQNVRDASHFLPVADDDDAKVGTSISTSSSMDFEYDAASRPAKKKTRQSSSPKSELLTKSLVAAEESSSGSSHDRYDEGSGGGSIADAITIAAEDENLRRVVAGAALMLTNAPPPTTFAVSARDKEDRLKMRLHHQGVASLEGSGEEENQEYEDEGEEDDEEEESAQDSGPLLFDGSVANATPGEGDDDAPAEAAAAAAATTAPPAAGLQQQQTGGGCGTVLHLACALDSPLSLAILLAMGGNALSRHTAFRRLVVHEAASSDSPDCLRLLLELADTYRETSLGAGVRDSIWNPYSEICAPGQNLHQQHQQQCHENHLQDQPYNSGRGLFLPPRTDDGGIGPGSDSLPYQSVFSSLAQRHDTIREAHQMLQPTHENAAEKRSIPETCGLSYVDTLKLISDLGKQVINGSLTDLDAGRLLMARVDVPEATKAAVVSICQGASSDFCGSRTRSNPYLDFLNFPSLGAATAEDRPRGDADGHGNTALHWASFKNAAECVSVLLSHNSDPNSRAEPSGWTPLHDAAYSDAADCVRMLVDAGADVDSRANSGATPLCFAAQEDSPEAARLLLEAGARPDVRCGQGGNTVFATNTNQQHQPHPSRFSGYTPLHYCAHYNAYRAAGTILSHEYRMSEGRSSMLLEMLDFNDKLPIHVAVTRSSSDVLREFLHGGARIDTRVDTLATSPPILAAGPLSSPSSPPRILTASVGFHRTPITPLSSQGAAVVTPVSSPILRSMIPPRPISSSKPWNCVTQESINQCRALIREAELNWCPERHRLFHPTDRRAVMELLRVGKRLEQMGTGICVYDVWPDVLSFCGRGWFEVDGLKAADQGHRDDTNEMCELQEGDASAAGNDDAKLKASSNRERMQSGADHDDDFTQFQLE
mmetsp:Transcript_1645/g.3156  ORF Transcript_1645/g.3156 Transcript_1645/m.3156 type:complete len:963 (+) Transcript_1645:348-3236(+)